MDCGVRLRGPGRVNREKRSGAHARESAARIRPPSSLAGSLVSPSGLQDPDLWHWKPEKPFGSEAFALA